jgi:hypothetical protein
MLASAGLLLNLARRREQHILAEVCRPERKLAHAQGRLNLGYGAVGGTRHDARTDAWKRTAHGPRLDVHREVIGDHPLDYRTRDC